MFRIYADFESDNAIDTSCIGMIITIIYGQNSVCNVYFIVSEIIDALQNGWDETRLGNDFVDWFVDWVIILEKKRISSLKTLKIHNTKIKADGKHYRKTGNYRFLI